MRVNMYGIGSCHDCVDAEKILLEKNVQLNYLDFSKSALHLKSFLKLRDTLPLMEEVREQIGAETPVYLTFDIDGLDPSVAPGTGTPEPGGLTSIQGIEIIRGCYGLNLIGADLVEVSPPYDTTGNTALLAANLAFEMLCSFPGCIRRK